MRALFVRAHALPFRRGENHSSERSASPLPALLSIQPKRSASTTASS
jgi:hypothetical protein